MKYIFEFISICIFSITPNLLVSNNIHAPIDAKIIVTTTKIETGYEFSINWNSERYKTADVTGEIRLYNLESLIAFNESLKQVKTEMQNGNYGNIEYNYWEDKYYTLSYNPVKMTLYDDFAEFIELSTIEIAELIEKLNSIIVEIPSN